jgi:hypothetical protein
VKHADHSTHLAQGFTPAASDGVESLVGGVAERLAVYGGELEAGRGRGGGFHVRARIPLTEAASP